MSNGWVVRAVLVSVLVVLAAGCASTSVSDYGKPVGVHEPEAVPAQEPETVPLGPLSAPGSSVATEYADLSAYAEGTPMVCEWWIKPPAKDWRLHGTGMTRQIRLFPSGVWQIKAVARYAHESGPGVLYFAESAYTATAAFAFPAGMTQSDGFESGNTAYWDVVVP